MADTILYVDDDLANLTVLEATCADEFDIVTCSDGREALALMRQREFAVLLLDQRMPGMTGVEVAAVATREAPDTVRILITAYSELGDAIDAINRGHVRGYLRKPWEPDVLKATLRDALELYRTRRRMAEMEHRLRETERVYALGVVAAGIAHELRNPLTVMSGMIDLMGMRTKTLLTELKPGVAPDDRVLKAVRELDSHLKDSRNAVTTLIEITKGIELSNRRSDSDETADFAEVVTLSLRNVQSALRRKGTLDLAVEAVPAVRGNKTKLGQVVLNLLINAVQAIPDGNYDGNFLRVRLASSGVASVRLEVTDTGPGIPDDVRGKIFDPFFTTKQEGGTGLGLAISKRIVDELGGKLDVSSEVGRGTTFTVTLPTAAR